VAGSHAELTRLDDRVIFSEILDGDDGDD